MSNLSKFIFIFLLTSIAQAQTKSFITLGLGGDRANTSNNTNITFIPPFYNNYAGSNQHDSEWLAGLFAGAETDINSSVKWQYGVSYYQNSAFQAHGVVNQFGLMNFANLNYSYKIQSKRYLLESKILFTLRKIFHPYFDFGLGESVNQSYSYMELPITTDAVPMAQPFANKTYHNFTYLIGLGLDYDIWKNVRLGAGYRYVSLGKAGLNPSPLQQDTTVITNKNIRTNEFIMQLTFNC